MSARCWMVRRNKAMLRESAEGFSALLRDPEFRKAFDALRVDINTGAFIATPSLTRVLEGDE